LIQYYLFNMIQKRFFYFLFLPILFSSCTSNSLDVDVSSIPISIEYFDLDSLLISNDSIQISRKLKALDLNDKSLIYFDLNNCIGLGNLDDSTFFKRLNLFLNDPYIIRLEKTIDNTFRVKRNTFENEINTSFAHLKYHFPNGKIPLNITFINSLFTDKIYCSETEIGIGVENYLGSNKSVVKELPIEEFFQWRKDGMNSNYLSRDVLISWIQKHYLEDKKGSLIEQMIYWGKVIYLLEACFPKQEKNILLRYTKQHYDWANNNEIEAWKYLVGEELVFSTNEREIANFINEGPFTVGISDKSPDRMGQFLGWRMVHLFMQHNTNVKIESLIHVPYNIILQSYSVDN
jgi:hypothetical protein